MTPYQDHDPSLEKAEFNKRHAAARMVVQGALTNLKERWQVLKGELWRPDKHRLPRIIYACCLLNNIMIDLEDADRDGMPASLTAGSCRETDYVSMLADSATNYLRNCRPLFYCDFFVSLKLKI
jgi:hypothetical protein